MLTLILSAGMLPAVSAELPLDELRRLLVQGQHSGFPYLLGRACPTPSMVSMHRRMNIQSLHSIGAHVAPLGMAFYTGKRFTADYRNRVESVEPFISGWLNQKNKPAGAGRWT